MKLKHLALAAGTCLSLWSAAASAGTVSFSGSFANDNDLQVVAFTTFAAGSVTLETYSYAGGVDPSGRVVAGGGFDTIFGLYDASGALISIGDDGATRVDSKTGAAFDAALTLNLTAGTYFVALSQFDNYPTGPLFSNGFSETGGTNFTSIFGCSAGKFCDLTGDSRTGAYELSITGGGIAAAVPEPSTFAMFAAALGAAVFKGRKRRQESAEA